MENHEINYLQKLMKRANECADSDRVSYSFKIVLGAGEDSGEQSFIKLNKKVYSTSFFDKTAKIVRDYSGLIEQLFVDYLKYFEAHYHREEVEMFIPYERYRNPCESDVAISEFKKVISAALRPYKLINALDEL